MKRGDAARDDRHCRNPALLAAGAEDLARVGGKNASLGELIRHLQPHGIAVPPGFATTADAYREFIAANNLTAVIHDTHEQLAAGTCSLPAGGRRIRSAILRGNWPAGIAADIVAVFHPRPVIASMSDFKTNEYANLVGGKEFEPKEENPMLGLRGASRYYSELYREGFVLECRAIRRLRETLGFDNVRVMIPFCRSPLEADRVL